MRNCWKKSIISNKNSSISEDRYFKVPRFLSNKTGQTLLISFFVFFLFLFFFFFFFGEKLWPEDFKQYSEIKKGNFMGRSRYVNYEALPSFFPSFPPSFLLFFFLSLFLSATCAAYESSQARGQIGAAAASLCLSHSNVESGLHL